MGRTIRDYRIAKIPAPGSIDELRVLDPHFRELIEARDAPIGSRLFVRGWAVEPMGGRHRLPAAVMLSIGEHRTVTFASGRFRRDIGLHFNDQKFGLSGFQGTTSLDGMSVGRYTIALYAIAEDRSTAFRVTGDREIEIVPSAALFPASARLPDGAMRVTIDSFSPFSQESSPARSRFRRDEVLVARGHAYDPGNRAPAIGAYAVIDDDHYVCGVQGLPSGPGDVPERSGFTIRVPTENLSRGRHRLAVAGFSALSEGYVLSKPIRFELSSRA